MNALKERVGIDCDDVYLESGPYLVGKYNQLYGTQVALKDYYSEDPKVWGVRYIDTTRQRFRGMIESEEFLKLAPVEEAVEVITRLQDPYDLFMITGRPSHLESITRSMADRHVPGAFSDIVFTNYLNMTGSGLVTRSKRSICEELGISVMLEDHLHHALDVAQGGTDVLLFDDYPWNQYEGVLPERIRRVLNWTEVGRILLDERGYV